MTEAAQAAAAYIRTVDPKLAALFIQQPFHRVQIAQAFSKGLTVPAGQHDYQMGQTIIDLAEMDQSDRLEAYAQDNR